MITETYYTVLEPFCIHYLDNNYRDFVKGETFKIIHDGDYQIKSIDNLTIATLISDGKEALEKLIVNNCRELTNDEIIIMDIIR